MPDRAVLDRAAPGLGITAATPDRIGNIWIEKDASSEPTGRLHGSVTNYYCDSDFWNNLLRQLPLLQPGAIIPGTESAMRAANATGVTTIYESHLMTFSLIEIYRWLRAEDRLTLRVLCCPEAELENARRAAVMAARRLEMHKCRLDPYGSLWPGVGLPQAFPPLWSRFEVIPLPVAAITGDPVAVR